ncbi:MAG: MarC family protein [Propionivibrio sp.]
MNGELFSSVFLLLLVLDPLGNMPFVLSLLRDVSTPRRRRIIIRECAISVLVLIVFLLVGDWLLLAMRLSDPALDIAGGLILFLIALRMVFPPAGRDPGQHAISGEPFIVPLAIPMIAGPSALATVLLASRQSGQIVTWIAAIVVANAINAAFLLTSGWFARIFGKPGMEALERLMGLILTTMAVQMLISGIRIAFHIA